MGYSRIETTLGAKLMINGNWLDYAITPLQSLATLAEAMWYDKALSTANGQSISTPCTSSMISSFSPCLNYLTGSSSNGSSPTADCCNSLKSLMGASMDCACLLVTASVPLPMNISRSLAISLPKACRASGVGGVPVQCQASAAPLSAPGPALFGPSQSPTAFSPQASTAAATEPAASPETQALPPADVEEPPTASGIRPVVTPSSSIRSYSASSRSVFMLFFVGFMASSLY